MFRKIELYILSLWLLFLLIIIINIDIPICFHAGCGFVDFNKLIKQGNMISLIAFILLIAGIIFYLRFKHIIEGAGNLPFEIAEIESIKYENLTFLTTYVIPLIFLDFNDVRYLIVLVLLLILIGVMFIRTDQFYANPTLALLNFHIYKANGKFKNNTTRKNIVLICKGKLSVQQKVSYIKLDERIYFAWKKAR